MGAYTSRLPLIMFLLVGLIFGIGVGHGQNAAAQIGPGEAPLPGNDDLQNATIISTFPYNDSIQYGVGVGEEATEEENERVCGPQQMGLGFTASVWYVYTANQDGLLNIIISPDDAVTNTSLGLYTGPATNPTHPLTEVACQDETGAGQRETLVESVTAGTTYYIRVATQGGFGDYQVDVLDNVAVYLPAVLKSPPPDAWQAQISPVVADLNSIDCPSTTFCVAVGDAGQVLTTNDGGTTWDSQPSMIANRLNGVSCLDEANCVAVGDNGRIIRSSNGGSSWNSESSGTGQILRGVGCAANTCFAVGGAGTSTGAVSFDDGDNWFTPPDPLGNTDLYGASCPNDGTCTVVGLFGRVLVFAGTGVTAGPLNLEPNLQDVDCPTDQVCLAVGQAGAVLKTSNGGNDWDTLTSGTGNLLRGVSCPDGQTESCFAVGDGGTIIATMDGSNWSNETSGTDLILNGVSCPTTTTCFAVGDDGTILHRGNGLLTRLIFGHLQIP